MQKLIDNFLKDVGQGHEWVGLVAANNWPILHTWIHSANFGKDADIDFNQAKVTWPGRECLRFKNFDKPGDYQTIHGWQFQWIGIYGQLPPDWDKFPTVLRSRNKIAIPKVRMIRET